MTLELVILAGALMVALACYEGGGKGGDVFTPDTLPDGDGTSPAPSSPKAKALSGAGKAAEKKPAAKGVKSPCKKCEEAMKKVKLVELVEVVKQGDMKSVEGAGGVSSKLKGSVKRKDKNGSAWKQYINLKKGVEDPNKPKPEYGRWIEVRARIDWENPNPDPLPSKTIHFAVATTKGDGRPNNLAGTPKEGFGLAGGPEKTTATTKSDGWTDPVKFYLSQYGGDQFTVRARLDKEVKPASSADQPELGPYEVWRKFWYQLTHAKNYAAKKPTSSQGNYKDVFADMIFSNKKEFDKSSLAAGVRAQTFYKEYMVKKGGSANEIAVIGTHNVGTFKAMLTREKSHPVKTNIIVCEYQCDPAGQAAPTSLFKMTSNPQVITVSSGGGGSIICKPPLSGGSLVAGNYGKLGANGAFQSLGNITDVNITIESGRASTKTVKVSLPPGVTAPTNAAPLWLKLKFQTANSFLGWATDKQVVCVYRPSVASGDGSEQDYNDTVTHEFGHLFNQTPKPGKQPSPMSNHPKQYLGHGGSGSHCATGSPNMPASQADRQKTAKTEPKIRPGPGACTMFASGTPHCIHKFCATCKPYVRLQDMSNFT